VARPSDPIQHTPPQGTANGLTAREREVSALIAHGMTNSAIATALVISERTVHRHVANILEKLDLRSRSQVAVWAHEHGLTTPPAP
jgi:DNA-binding NarL/FixJ family response regulator